jgi:uncharacterized membrane protein YedE/YeeE
MPDVVNFTPISGLLGGALIGLSATLLLLLTGRVAGISGIVGGLLTGTDRAWRGAFVVGLMGGGALVQLIWPGAIGASPAALPVLAGAGVLVGFGTRLGGGCTSGHGVCGMSRLSVRSLVATLTFMGVAVLTVLAVRMLGGGS